MLSREGSSEALCSRNEAGADEGGAPPLRHQEGVHTLMATDLIMKVFFFFGLLASLMIDATPLRTAS